MDLAGPMQVTSIDGKKYLFLLVDDYTHCGIVYVVAAKSEALEIFKEYQLHMEKETEREIKGIQSDGGGEFIGMQTYLKSQGIVLHLTIPYHPKINEVKKCYICTIMEGTHVALKSAKLLKSYWSYAAKYISYSRNWSPHSFFIRKTTFV
jgi:hypothetical protein